MNIGLLNEKIVIQKNIITSDAVGNHISSWEDFYSCHATVSGEGADSEKVGEAQTINASPINFTIRWCKRASEVTSTEFRVKFRGEVFDIVGIDHMNYKKKSIKLNCRRLMR